MRAKQAERQASSDVEAVHGEKELAKLKAQCALVPAFNAACIAEAFSVQGELKLKDLVDGLKERCKEVRDGNLRRVESMLVSQAHSLDMIFTSLARRGIAHESLKVYEAHMKLALKAQSQCRATLETLAAIKNPPVVFARQANFSQGLQQVNNSADGHADVREIENKPNELLEHNHDQRLDNRTTRTASGSDQAMATLESVDRPANIAREGRSKSKRMEGRNKATAAPGRGGAT